MRNILMMANYNTWANQQIFRICSKLTDSEYRKDRGVFFGSIHNTLNHLLLVDILWLSRYTGRAVDYISSLDQILYDDFESLHNARVEWDRVFVEYVEGLDPADLEKTLTYSRMSGVKSEGSRQELLFTLLNHQTHHRGQVHAMLTQAGISNSDMPAIDLIDYLAVARA